MASLPSLKAPMPLTDKRGRPLSAPAREPVGVVGNPFELLRLLGRKEDKKERTAIRNAAKNAATASSSVSDDDATATVYSDAATVSSPRRGPRLDDEFDLDLLVGAHPRGLRRLVDFLPARRTVVAVAVVFLAFLGYFLSADAPGATLR